MGGPSLSSGHIRSWQDVEALARRRQQAAGSRGRLALYTCAQSLLLFALFAAIEKCARVWLPLGVLLYGVVLLASLGMLWIVVYGPPPNNADAEGDEVFLTIVVSGLISASVAYSQLCRNLHLTVGGFEASGESFWHWARFGFNELLNGLSMDLPAIFRWRFTEVQPVALWSKSLHYLFHVILLGVGFSGLYKLASTVKHTWTNPERLVLTRGNLWFLFSRDLLPVLLIAPPVAVVIGKTVQDALQLPSPWPLAWPITVVLFGATLTALPLVLWVQRGRLTVLIGLLPPIPKEWRRAGYSRLVLLFLGECCLTAAVAYVGLQIAEFGIGEMRWSRL
jgi:hypothetical protein